MKGPLTAVRQFTSGLGPVEQAQVVASTAVVVTMATIVTAMVVTGQPARLMDFISVLAVGTIGFTSVYFSLQYSRQLDEQRRQLLALNTIAEAVNRVVDLPDVLQTALEKVTEMLPASTGWIYLLEEERLVLKSARGSTLDFMMLHEPSLRAPSLWLSQPRVEREGRESPDTRIHPSLKEMGIQFWASIPLHTISGTAGTLVVAGGNYAMFTAKQAELMETFGNQISVALNNAVLFERLKASEQRYADLFENAPDLYVSVNREHSVVGCNRTGADMLGYPRDRVLGLPLEALFASDRQTALATVIEQMFAEGKALENVEEQMRKQDGHPLSVMLNSTLVFDDSGRTVNARIVARDITERKRMEGALLHAQKIDSIGNLAGGIAHDFNNILAAILGSASIMRRRLAARSNLRKYVEIIESSARRGSSLTRQLLTFARKTETIVEPVDVNQVITETIELFRRSVTRGITIRTVLSTDRVTISGDSGQVQQALLNLFLNARDAMPGGGTLVITTDVTAADARTASQFSSVQPGLFVTVRVEDTGHGIPPDIQNRIFEPFFTTKDHGTGLGLSVVYGVVQNHGGFITMETTPGHGTTMTVFLPRVLAATQARAQARRRRIPRGTEQILIIDDEQSVCEVARDMLTELGYTVHLAYDGEAGVDFYRKRQGMIDLILLDINMPVMGGKEAFALLRALNPAVPIVIVTGYGREAVETSAFSSEISGFLQKPFQLDTLATKVRQVLDGKTIPHQSVH